MSAVLNPKPLEPPKRLEVEATVTSKGQITLPVALRERLGIAEGTKVRFIHDAAGTRFETQKPISAYRGFLKHLGPLDTTIPKEPDRDFDFTLKDFDPEHLKKRQAGTAGLGE
jgi:AbrB family looped-hinge helix DNA binding protein